MLTDITLGQYFPGNSAIHKLDPRSKIIGLLIYIILLFCVNNFLGFLAFFIFTAIIVCLSKIHIKHIFSGLRAMLFLIIFTSVINIFMTGGETVLFSWWIFTATLEGVLNALKIILRLFFLIVASSLLTLTTSPIMLTDGLEKLLSPFSKIGLPSSEIAMMMTIAIRFIPTILEETDKIIKAQTARGADFADKNIIKKVKALIPILVPLFISAFRRADELALAMECRCYRGGKGRTRLKELKFSRVDLYSVLAGIVFAVTVIGTGMI